MKSLVCLLLFCTVWTAQAQKQGLQGQVFWVSGNQMPSPDAHLSPNQGTVREVLIYELTNFKDVTQVGPFFRDVKTKFVASVMSSPDGTFKLKLLPGAYSVFTREKSGLYANLSDDKNNINPVVVKAGQYAWLTITLDYEAAY